MNQSPSEKPEGMEKTRQVPIGILWGAGFLLLLLTGVLAWLAQSFPYGQPPDRPIREVVWVSWIASAVSLVALLLGLRVKANLKSLLGLIVAVAIASRLILVFSNPILEVDYYRYLWDGIAANNGVAPYKFSPDAVLRSNADNPELKKLQAAIERNPSARTIVSRVHFAQYTTLYPPVSQFVFQTATALIPDSASAETHVTGLKFALVLFDFGVVLILAWLLAMLGKHPAWLIVYAWNPLVLKEIANGGHLDSIAIFFMTAGIATLLWVSKRHFEVATNSDQDDSRQKHLGELPVFVSFLSGALMAMGLGAKLFPVIFMPAMFFFLLFKGLGRQSLAFAIACILVSVAVMWPMSNPKNKAVAVQISETENGPDKAGGLAVFMTNWRMNDAIFSGIYQNVEYDWGKYGPAWYVFVPNDTRVEWCRDMAKLKLANGNPAYFVARLVTVGLFGLVYLWILFRLWRAQSTEDLANLLFLTIGLFFYLQPTQNPWYWLWAMPLVCFAKNKGWLFVSLILFVYYLRFWFTEKAEHFEFAGRIYVGHDFYDHCIVWIEFAVVLTILFSAPMIEKALRRKDSVDSLSVSES